MGNKKITILILVGAAGVAFGVSFALSRRFIAPAAVQAGAGPAAPGATETAAGKKPPASAAAPDVPRIEEKHLYDLIKEVRQKVHDCQVHEQQLDEQEKRVQIARQLVEKESQNLENLRVQLATAVTRLKEAQGELEKTRITIDSEEAANLKRVAAVYDKMEPAVGGRILEGMCANSQEADAVKILHAMSERNVAKLLAEITDKNLAARLCEQMKRVREQGGKQQG